MGAASSYSLAVTPQERAQFLQDDIKRLSEQIHALNAALTIKKIELTELQSPFRIGERFRYHGRKRFYQRKVFEIVGFHENGPVMCYVMPDGILSKRFIIMQDSSEWTRIGINTERQL